MKSHIFFRNSKIQKLMLRTSSPGLLVENVAPPIHQCNGVCLVAEDGYNNAWNRPLRCNLNRNSKHSKGFPSNNKRLATCATGTQIH